MVSLQVGVDCYGSASRFLGRVALFILHVGVGYYGYTSGWGRLVWLRFRLG